MYNFKLTIGCVVKHYSDGVVTSKPVSSI